MYFKAPVSRTALRALWTPFNIGSDHPARLVTDLESSDPVVFEEAMAHPLKQLARLNARRLPRIRRYIAAGERNKYALLREDALLRMTLNYGYACSRLSYAELVDAAELPPVITDGQADQLAVLIGLRFPEGA